MAAPSEAHRSMALAVFLTLGGCGGGDELDSSAADGGEEVGGDGRSDTEVGRGADGDDEAGPEAVGGPLTFAVTDAGLLVDRLCDFDGDGVGDNAVADLGGTTAILFAEYMNARMHSESNLSRPYLIHMPWVEDVERPADSEIVAMFLVGMPPRQLEDRGEEIYPEGPYYAARYGLDSCGEPLFRAEHASIDNGFFAWTGGLFPVPLVHDELVTGREPEVTGSVSQEGETIEAEVCLYATIADLAALTFDYAGTTTTPLAIFVAGGRAVGVPTVPGLEPDVDLDGDGLERFVLDELGAIVSCVDGDASLIEGADCWLDPRMADAFGLAYRFEGQRSSLLGRFPRWEREVGGECPSGPPEPSHFDSPVYDSVGCAAFEEVCEPFAPEPCCEPDSVCTGSNEFDYRCFRVGCEPPLCDYGDEPGYCASHGTGRICVPLWRYAENVSPCEPLVGGCATEYAVTEGTVCLEYTSLRGIPIWKCFESCTSSPNGCDTGYVCAPQRFTDQGVCARQVVEE